MKLLYAEDEMALSLAVTEILKMEGFEVDNAYDGRKALELAVKNNYDVCILDIMMPYMQGTDVLKTMREKEIFTPVLLLTAKTTTENKIEGLSIGADDYLCKPFETPELIARIKSLNRRFSNSYKKKESKFANITLNHETGELKSDKSSVILSSKEVKFLNELIVSNQKKLLISEVVDKALGEGSSESAAKLYILYIENKLKQVQAKTKLNISGEWIQIQEILD